MRTRSGSWRRNFSSAMPQLPPVQVAIAASRGHDVHVQMARPVQRAEKIAYPRPIGGGDDVRRHRPAFGAEPRRRAGL